MFLAMESHDIGCGPGGGRNSADVFKKTGLTVLTNAKISEEDLQRSSVSCGGSKRRRRASEDLSTILNPFKYEFDSDVAKLVEEGIWPKTRRDFRESLLFEVEQLNNTGQLGRTICCPESVMEWTVRAIGVTADKGICIAEPADVSAFKKFFIQLDLPYKVARFEQFEVNAAIFNYEAAQKTVNVYLESVEGLCYKTESGTPTPKMQIELPPNDFRIVRFPIIPLRKGLFTVRVTAFVFGRWYPEFDAIEKKIYVVSEGMEENVTIQVCLDPHNRIEDCPNDARIIKEDTDFNGIWATSVLRVDLTLPENSIPGTGKAVGYMQSVITDNVSTVIEGLHSSLKRPGGNGLTTIALLAQNVYTLTYLRQTKQSTADIEVQLGQWIRYGVTRAVTQFRHTDGSYSISPFQQSSTWLTAFAAKVFCQTRTLLDDSITVHIVRTFFWLAGQVTVQGSFIEESPVKNRRTFTGQVYETDSSLTAYVLITLLECGFWTGGIRNDEIMKSTLFLENSDRNVLKNNPYLLALSTYALAKTNSPRALEFKNLLHDIQNKKGEGIYWGNADGFPANANAVETTSYALLAMIEFKDLITSAHIVRWLISQRGEQNSFNTIQETVIGLQSLSAYFSASENLDLEVQIFGRDRRWGVTRLTPDNTVRQLFVRNLPVEENSLLVKVAGVGHGKLTIDLRYNRPATDEELCPYNISDIEVVETYDLSTDSNFENERNCDVCGLCERSTWNEYDYDDSLDVGVPFGRIKRHTRRNARADTNTTCIRFSVSSKTDKVFGMTVVNVGLDSGVQLVKDDLDKLLNDDLNIVRYEMPNNGRDFVVFYLKQVTLEKTRFIFRLADFFKRDVNLGQLSSVKVYDYHKPDHACSRFHGTETRQSSGLNYICDEKQEQCQCLPSLCSHPVDVKRIDARSLHKFTCNPWTANYAVIVKIDNMVYDPVAKQKLADGRVVKSLRDDPDIH